MRLLRRRILFGVRAKGGLVLPLLFAGVDVPLGGCTRYVAWVEIPRWKILGFLETLEIPDCEALLAVQFLW